MSGYRQYAYYDDGEDPSSSTSGSISWDYSPSSRGSTWPTSSNSRLDPRSPISPYLSSPSPGAYAPSDAGTPDPDYSGGYSTSQSYLRSSLYAEEDYSSQPHLYADDGYSPAASPNNDYPSSSKQTQEHGHVCLAPKCPSKPFKRNADLDRHYKQRHLPDGEKDTYHCDYSKCPRKDGQPFHRKDHFRDHLREYHNEDLGKRGKHASPNWADKKYVKKDWWRCTRCLKRVVISKNEYECPDCKAACDSTRVKVRRSM